MWTMWWVMVGVVVLLWIVAVWTGLDHDDIDGWITDKERRGEKER